MKASNLIKALEKLDPNTLMYVTDWDSEFDITYVWLVENVTPWGKLVLDYVNDHPDKADIQKQEG